MKRESNSGSLGEQSATNNPSVGFCLLITELWGHLCKGRHLKAAVVIPGVALLFFFAVGIYSYSRVWRNEVTLYSEMVIKEPEAVIRLRRIDNDRADSAAQLLSDLNARFPSCPLLMESTGKGEP